MRVEASAQRAVSVTPNDSTPIAAPLSETVTRGLYVGGTGNLAVKMADGTTVTFTGISAGIIHPLSVTHVLATSTTATGIVAVY